MSGKNSYSKGGGGNSAGAANDSKSGKSNGGNSSNNQQSRYQRQMQGKQGQSSVRTQGQSEKGIRKENVDRNAMRLAGDAIDEKFGFHRMKDGPERLGWLLNYNTVTMADETGAEKSALDLYYIDRLGENFKATVFFQPYFYIDVKDVRRFPEITACLIKKFDGCSVEQTNLEDLDLANHLSGKKHKFLKISFGTVNELMEARNELKPLVVANQIKVKDDDYEEIDYEVVENSANLKNNSMKASLDPLAHIVELREFDVPYSMRVSIDLDLRVGSWYVVRTLQGTESCTVHWQKDMLELCEPKILAFDIECEKAALKFPNADNDRIYMISYMTPGQGYLITNREIVSADVDDFEYTPLPKYPGPFIVYSEPTEEALLRKFISHCQELRPHVVVTYNGDFFDWPYVDKRCSKFGISIYAELGIKLNAASSDATEGEYCGRAMVHLDAFCWVKRDSYLPQGTQGLKAVTKNKLGYDPVEVDPEDMLTCARERPAYMAAYSVSDAVATYYLYTTFVHNFIFSMSTIIPMGSEDVLRKGSGTLCEALLMVEAFKGTLICPNKQVDPLEEFHEGHLLESQTYIGGHVECLEAGVFRADIPAKFNLVPSALQDLIDHIDRDLTFALETEHGVQRSDVDNYDSVRQSIVCSLEMLRDRPLREEPSIIYHLDVGAMYPNIILTNRLQPSAIVSQQDCASCVFNRAESNCKRPMTWTWRGEYSPATSGEFQNVKRQLQYEKLNDGTQRTFSELNEKDQSALVRNRLKLYSNSVYRKTKVTEVKERVDTVCMRETGFYVNTVRAFRDRRYDYKLKTKQWKGKKIEAEKKGDSINHRKAEDMETLMDSLQLAHKCILNSFYGYVMRKGARWRSMEMAGIVTYTGAQLIKQARELVEKVGRPLELDTDGIWCILPASFPQDFKFKLKGGKGSIPLGYPCAMLNADVHDRYTNHQYQDLSGPVAARKYVTHSECSIFFELDGPYRAMVLPASPEEGKLLKKKYAVFNFDGSIAELKGFELKRRGELELVKAFQSQVFEQFLHGTSLEECYAAVGSIGNRWLDVLDTQGMEMDDDELLMLISERKTISKTIDQYEGRKATSLSAASRIADFLGAEMVKDKGLNCNLIISRFPAGAPVTDRAIPVAIFSADPKVKQFYLRKWLKEPSLECSDFRGLVDWQYYTERLSRSIQKIVTIPAGLQHIENPCPRVKHPVWLQRNMNEKDFGFKQAKISSYFNLAPPSLVAGVKALPSSTSTLSQVAANIPILADMEDIAGLPGGIGRSGMAGIAVAHYKGRGSKRPASPSKSDASLVEESVLTEESHVLTETSTSSVIVDQELFVVPVQVPPMMISPPGKLEDLERWLMDRKNTWRGMRAQKKREKNALLSASIGNRGRSTVTVPNYDEDANEGGRKKPLGVVDFVKNASLAASHGFWQVIELQTTDTAGEFVVWALTSKTQLQRLKITVPRTLYVNCIGRKAEDTATAMNGRKIERHLPHNNPGGQLYEVQISERKFIRNEKTLAQFLSDPYVEGIYESQTPLWFRAIMSLGCVARPTHTASSNNNGSGEKVFKIEDLELIKTTAHPYLNASVSSYRKIFIYISADQTRSSGLACVGIFIIDNRSNDGVDLMKKANKSSAALNSNHNPYSDAPLPVPTDTPPPPSGRAFVWLVTGNSYGQDAKPPLQRIYRKFQTDERGTMKFTTSFTSSLAEAYKLCGEKLTQYQSERRGPTLVLAQSNKIGFDPRAWRKNIPALQEFPVCTVPPNSTDDLYPAVGWQMFASERMVQRFNLFPMWYEDRLSCSRYAQVPVCNLGRDALTSMTDILFARSLQANRHLLWATESEVPDLGGSETDKMGLWSDTLSEPVVNNPGAYRSVCVELDLSALAVCAIMSSSLLDSEEGFEANKKGNHNSGNGNDDNNENDDDNAMQHMRSVTGDAGISKAYQVLKGVMAGWINDYNVNATPISESMISSLYRYLCGYGNALLTDPALHGKVYGLMTKLFKRLLSVLKKLGTTIVYASFSRIIIHTDKEDIAAAQEYINFILSAIGEKEIFQYLEMETKTYWEQVLWLGPDNWGAILLVEENENNEEIEENDSDSEEGREVGRGVEREEGGGGRREERGGGGGDREEGNDMENGRQDEGTKQRSVYEINEEEEEEEEEFGGGERGLEMKNKNGSKTKQNEQQKNGNKSNKNSEKYDEFAFLDNLLDGKKDKNDKVKKSSFSSALAYSKRNELGNSEDENEGDEDEDEEDENEGEGGYYYGEGEEEELVEDETGAKYSMEEKVNPLLQAHWTLASYLPPAAAEYFKFIVGEFMIQYRNRKRMYVQARNERLDLIQSHPTQADKVEEEISIPLEDDEIRDATNEFMRKLVKQQMGTRLLNLVDELANAYGQGASSFSSSLASSFSNGPKSLGSTAFPQQAGSHLPLDSPALEFTNSVTHVLGLDSTLTHEVTSLKRLLLAQLRVREFSPESEFRDPALTYILKDVICSFCTSCRDMDLLRDATLTQSQLSLRWKCGNCGNNIDTVEIENRLLEEVERLSTVFLLQDMRCPVTHMVSSRLCASITASCKSLSMDMTVKEFQDTLSIILRVAQFYRFSWLETTVLELMS